MRSDGEAFSVATIIDGRYFEATASAPLVFGRADVAGEVVGLDPFDMGISAVAGAVELMWGVWWVHNRSAKRYLLLEDTPGAPPRRLGCGDRHALSSAHLTVLVPGAVFTHRIELRLPAEYLSRLRQVQPSQSGTVTNEDIRLSERDRQALVAVLAGFLETFPRYHPHPTTYADAAGKLGPPWDGNRVRKQVERFRSRLAAAGIYIDGPRANYDLAEFLISNQLITASDLVRVNGPCLPVERGK
jgi:hypothetical protein